MRRVADRIWGAVVRARAETASRASEEKYRLLADSMDEGIEILRMIWDADGRPVDAEVLMLIPPTKNRPDFPVIRLWDNG